MARDISAGGHLVVGDAAAVDITGTALTIHAWIYRTGTPGGTNRSIVGKWENTTEQYLFYLADPANVLAIQIHDGTGADVATGVTVPTVSTWASAAAVKNGTGAGALKVFLNGAQDGSATSNRSIRNTAAPVEIGRFFATNASRFPGSLAEVAIWDAALSADELVALAKGFSALLVRPQSLKGYWPIIGNASPEPDLRSGNNGTVSGTPTKLDHPRILVPRPAEYVP